MKTFDYLGHYRYTLTFCTLSRRPVFTTTSLVQAVLLEILRAAADKRFGVLACCFMPDHLHLMVEGAAPDADLRRVVRMAKQRSGYRAAVRDGDDTLAVTSPRAEALGYY